MSRGGNVGNWAARVEILSASLLLFSYAYPVAVADEIAFKNGDRLSGSIVRSDGKSLVINTDIAGELTVQWPQIEELHSEQRLHVGLVNGETLAGKVTSRLGTFEVLTDTNLTVEAPIETVAVLRNDAEQEAYDKSQNQSFLQGWEGGLDAGFELTRGNSRTKNFRLAFRTARKSPHDKLTVYAESIYSVDELPAAKPRTTANENKGGLRFDRDFTSRFFVFANADFMSDALQDLNLRSVLGGGIGYHVIKRDRTTLDLFGGPNFTREKYVEFERNLLAAQASEEFMHKVGKSTTVTQTLSFFPEVTEQGGSGINYRANFTFGTVTRLNKWLGWQNNFSDAYVTNPPAGKKQNELVFTSGLNIALLH